jgi:hypothetical protein
MKHAVDFYDYARIRFSAKLNKDNGLPKPYSSDRVLQQFRFCNVHREDDTVTKWIRKHVTFERYGAHLLGAIAIARWFNRVETLEKMVELGRWDLLGYWSTNLEDWADEMRKRLANVKPLVTGAYRVGSPAKMNKLEGIIWCLQQFLPQADHCQEVMSQKDYTLEDAALVLTQFYYLGPFMSYEVVMDLRHTPVLQNAPDIMYWANPGPGCARGLSRVLGEDKDFFDEHNKNDVAVMIQHMYNLLQLSKDENYWPQSWPKWEMREVEHTLCEFDKYQRVLLGEGTPRRRYKGEKD